jgi:hypothetical protein
MRKTVKFPALMAARPPKHKNPRISVCAFETVVDLAEISSSDFPVALVSTMGATKTEYRYARGKLYRSCHTDVDRFLERHESQFIDSRRSAYASSRNVTGHIVREMYRDVKNISDYSNDRFWPKSAMHLLKAGMHAEWPDVKDIIAISPTIDLRGPWLEKVAESDYMSFLSGDPDVRIARYERKAHEAFSAFKVMNGQVWCETMEPCYVAQMLPDGIGHISHGHVANYVRDADTSPERTWWNHLDNWVFSAREYDEVISKMTNYARPVEPIEIIIPEALTADIPSLEIDRCARVLAEVVSETMANRTSGGQGFLSLPSTRSMAAWTELLDLVEGYNPFNGVPDEIEERIAAMVESVAKCDTDNDLIPERIRLQVSRHLEKWEDRPVDLGFTEERSVRP